MFKDYGNFKIEIDRVEIADQGITALWGPSGAGKTSLFRLMLGLESCDGMVWEMNGTDLARLPIAQRRLGVVFQSLELFPHMTAQQNILFAAQARHLAGDGARAHLSWLSEELQIEEVLSRPVRVLSGGEQQRVALARALIGKPRFLFLDEPFSALDVQLKQQSRRLVQQVIQRSQTPTLLITHDLDDVKALAHTVLEMQRGRITGQHLIKDFA